MNLQKKIDAIVAAYPSKDQARVEGLLTATVESLGELVATHWKEIDGMILEQESLKGSISLGVKIDVSDKQPKITTKISFARKYSDSIDQVINGPTESVGETAD